MSAPIQNWHELTGKQIDALDRTRTVVLVQCSPLEVHGPHLPTMADIREAEGLTERAAELLAEKHPEIRFVRLPWMFVAADVLPHRGSIKFSPRTVRAVIEELGTSLGRQGFVHAWIGSFHGGPRHVSALELGAHRAHRATGIQMISMFSLLVKRLTGGGSDLAGLLGGLGGIGADELKGDSHGGLVETAMLLHLAGPHVDRGFSSLPPRSLEIDLAERGQPPLQRGTKATLLELLRGFPLKQRYYERETYAGAPAKASAELGKLYLDRLAHEAAAALSDRYTGALRIEDCKSPLWPLRHLMMSRTFGRAFEAIASTKASPV
jgi:creatinine amidohydrolase